MLSNSLPTVGSTLTSAGRLLTTSAFYPAHRFALQLQFDAAVDETIQNRVCQCWIVDGVMPILERICSGTIVAPTPAHQFIRF